MRTNTLALYFCLFFLVYSFTVQSQSYLIQTEELSIENGLSNRFVRSIVQDTKGFMWFATNNGLNRYDGYNFKVFTQKNSKIQSNFTSELFEDVDNNLWVGHAANNEDPESFSAIDIMNINTFEIQPLETYLGANFPCSIQDVYEIYSVAENKYLYITTKTGKVYVYKGNKQFDLLYDCKKEITIRAFYWGETYNWLYCGNELIFLDKEGKSIGKHFLEIDPLYRCSFMGEASNKAIWLETNDRFRVYKLCYWDVETDSLEINKPFDFFKKTIPTEVNSAFEYREKMNCSLYKDKKALRIFDSNQEEIYNQKFRTHKSFIRTVYIDRQENIWLGGMTKGLLKITYQKNKFKSYLQGVSTRSIIELEGDSLLLLNSYEGQHAYNLLTNKKEELDTFTYLEAKESQDGRFIWLSSSGTHVKRIERKAPFKSQHYYYKKNARKKKEEQLGQKLAVSWAIEEDVNGKVWVGTANGLSYIEKGADSISVFEDYRNCPELGDALINYLYENEKGLWLGTSQGLYAMNLKTGAIQCYNKDMEAPYKLPYNHIYYIFEAKNGDFWLSTRGGGLLKFNLETGVSRQFTKEDGLSHNVIYALLEDAHGYLWMSSDYGLMRMNLETNVINTYLTEDGILHQEFNRKSSYKASNGLLYFGGLSGIIGFDPGDFLSKEEQDVPLYVVQYRFFNGEKGKEVNATAKFLKEKKIILNYTDRFFTIELALLDYRTRKKRQYAYKIEGLEEEWTFTTNNSIRINNLLSGNYTLLIKAEGSSGLWSTTPMKIPIVVKKPFYLTWQFLLFIGILLLVLILLYSRWREQRLYKVQLQLEKEVSKRTRKIEQQADELRELDHIKSRFFANISHELRTPLTLMLGPISAILEKHYGEKLEDIEPILKLVKRNGIQLQDLIEEILILSKLEGKSVGLDEKEVCLLPLLKRLFFAFEAHAHLQGIEWSFSSRIEEEMYVLLDVNKFEKILNNILSNALKYTARGGIVELKIEQEKEEGAQINLRIEIIDSGKGIHSEDLPYIFDRFYQSKRKEAIIQGGTGIGLALTQEFVQLLKGKIEVKSKVNEGTSFLLFIPVSLVKKPTVKFDLEVTTEEVILPSNPFKDKERSNILIVEDNDDMRTFLVGLLGTYYDTITAENGKIALDILIEKGKGVDLIISDVMMPEMDGFELLQKVKSNADWQQLPMILLTARATEQDKLFALKIGVDDYLQKPFSPEELFVRVQNLIQNYTQRKIWQLEEPKDDEKIEIEEMGPVPVAAGKWMEDLETVVKREVGNTQFNITSLAYDLNLSERQLRRKIKTKTGLTPNQYFRIIKLDKAREYLENRRYETVAEVAHKIGFSNAHYFSKKYEAQYGKKPIEYLKD
jgi:signal transduction histidine kinase/ligand-binding sensor domain-containing protein/DNA-binding response OmpR family regulator